MMNICYFTNKIQFDTEKLATLHGRLESDRLSANRKAIYFRAYHCDVCRKWHNTKQAVKINNI